MSIISQNFVSTLEQFDLYFGIFLTPRQVSLIIGISPEELGMVERVQIDLIGNKISNEQLEWQLRKMKYKQKMKEKHATE